MGVELVQTAEELQEVERWYMKVSDQFRVALALLAQLFQEVKSECGWKVRYQMCSGLAQLAVDIEEVK